MAMKPTHLFEAKTQKFAQIKRKLTWVKIKTGFMQQASGVSCVCKLAFICALHGHNINVYSYRNLRMDCGNMTSRTGHF